MPLKKYNWSQLKLEFFLSDFDEVKGFFEHKVGIYNAGITRRTKGWKKEKKAFKRTIINDALKKFQDEQKEKMDEALDNLMGDISQRLERDKVKELPSNEIFIYWKILMTMSGRPIVIRQSRNECFNTEIPLEEIMKANQEERQRNYEKAKEEGYLN